MHIEIFDDSLDVLEIARDELTALGHSVAVTADMQQQMNTLEKHAEEIDVFICDLICPPIEKEFWDKKGIKYAPYGAIISLWALRVRIPNVILVSDQGHHADPSGGLLDAFYYFLPKGERDPSKSRKYNERQCWSPIIMGDTRLVVLPHKKSRGEWGSILNSLKTGPDGYPYGGG